MATLSPLFWNFKGGGRDFSNDKATYRRLPHIWYTDLTNPMHRYDKETMQVDKIYKKKHF